MLETHPLTSHLGAEIRGLDLRSMDSACARELTSAFERHSVLAVRGQTLEKSDLSQVARHFGVPVAQVNVHQRAEAFPEIGVLASDGVDLHGTGKRVINGTTWHTDHSFTERPPKATMLYAVALPEVGGETSFCNMRAAYAALSQEMRARIDPLHAVHCYESSRSPRKMMGLTEAERRETGDVTHPLVRTNAVTGEKALYLSTTRLERIVELPRKDSDELLDTLFAHATSHEFTYDHVWLPGDLLIWDNRCLMHHANANYPVTQRRMMLRVMIEGERPA